MSRDVALTAGTAVLCGRGRCLDAGALSHCVERAVVPWSVLSARAVRHAEWGLAAGLSDHCNSATGDHHSKFHASPYYCDAFLSPIHHCVNPYALCCLLPLLLRLLIPPLVCYLRMLLPTILLLPLILLLQLMLSLPMGQSLPMPPCTCRQVLTGCHCSQIGYVVYRTSWNSNTHVSAHGFITRQLLLLTPAQVRRLCSQVCNQPLCLVVLADRASSSSR